jgi:DNA-binding transcriptional LysR family regulator
MENELLAVLIAAAESRNFREAAAKLKISQPAVSLKLRELERLQPVPLFQLEGKRKVLTHFGRALYQLAKRDLAVLGQNIEALHRLYGNPTELSVRIGGRFDLLEYLAPYLEFAGRVEFLALSSRKAVEKLLSHEIDIAVSYQKPDSTEIIARPLLVSKPLLALHNRWLKGKRLTIALARDPKFLKETPSILYNADGHLLKEWVEAAGLSMEELHPAFVAEDWRTIQALVERGIGYAIVPSYVHASPEVQRVPVEGKGLEDYIFYALFEKGLKKIPAFQQLLAFAKVPYGRGK